MNMLVKIFKLLLFFVFMEKSALALNTDFSSLFSESFSNISYDLPLFLTPYIENGAIEAGRSLSRVGQLPNAPKVPSYSGYFTVNKEHNSNLFFWFFPAMNKDIRAPVILWLQGGPGASGLLGLFAEHGPYKLYSNTTAGLREHTWAKEFHVIYVDSPVGTGFSFTGNEKGYAAVEDQVANDLYAFLQQFFKVYSEYRQNDFYIFGESYGGKHVLYLGYKMHVDGPPAELNFKGISIGNGFFDVRTLNHYDEFLYQLGFIDYKQASIIKSIYNAMDRHLQKGENFLALKELNKYFSFLKDPDIATTPYLTQFTGYGYFYNFLFTEKPEDYSYHEDYIQSPQSRRAIHVENLPYHDQFTVMHYLKVDVVVGSSTDKLATLVDNYKVLIYTGQLDLVFPFVQCESLLMNNLTWKHSNGYKAADKKVWRLGKLDYVAGYIRNFGNLFGVLVRNAGHFVPHDQPKVALELITRFIKDIPYT